MTINIDVSKVKDWQEIWGTDDTEHQITVSAMWCATWIGMSGITEENWEEFYRRVNAWFLVDGTNGMVVNDGSEFGKKIPLTPADIHRRIGMRVNVTPVTKAAFNKLIIQLIDEGTKTKVNRFNKENINA
jgi:hypothetical protein